MIKRSTIKSLKVRTEYAKSSIPIVGLIDLSGTATVEPNGTSDGKQVVAPNGLYPAYEEKQFLPAKNQGSESQYKSLAPPVAIPDRGRRRTRLITLGIMIAIIVVVVSVPTGVEVSKNKRFTF